MKLKIDLVPETAWYSNLRNNIPKSEWDKIRKQSYNDTGHKCSICNKNAKLNCHEIWDYDDKNNIQTLKGFVALCDNCHMIKHIGFAGIQASKGLLDMNKLVKHFTEVNNVTKEVFGEHYKQSFEVWRERSQKEWTTDLGRWKSLVKDKQSKLK